MPDFSSRDPQKASVDPAWEAPLQAYLAHPGFWLEFPAAIEQRFLLRGRPGRLKRFMFCLRWSVGVLAALALCDWLLLGEARGAALGLRLLALGACGLGLWLLPRERFAASREQSMVWLCVVVVVCQMLTIIVGGGVAVTLYEGALVLALLLCNQVARVRFRQALPFTVLWWALFVLLEALGAGSDWMGVASASVFAGLLAAMSLSSKRAMELDNRATFALKSLNAISAAKLAQANAELLVQAHYDGLTQLVNRRLFADYLERMWRNAEREGSALAALFVDVDHFKLFNDTYGHHAGDDCLVAVAGVVRYAARRPLDIAARYGGEEFVVLLQGADEAAALTIAEDLCREVEQMGLPPERHPLGRVTVSIGVCAGRPGPGTSSASLLDAADRALYQAKQTGRNRVLAMPMEPPGAQG